jgi:hypothetical protein
MSDRSCDEIVHFKGELSRFDSDGFGVVKFDDYGPDSPSAYGTFSERVWDRDVFLKLKKGVRVKGDAVKFGEAHRIIEIEIDG